MLLRGLFVWGVDYGVCVMWCLFAAGIVAFWCVFRLFAVWVLCLLSVSWLLFVLFTYLGV